MNILRNYRHFINEAVDTDKEIKSLTDVPTEVIDSTKEILNGIFDKVRKPSFDFIKGKLVVKFQATQQDFNFADDTEPLTLDLTEGARKKREYDVVLTYLDGTSETFELQYVVSFNPNKIEGVDDYDDYDDDVEVIDEYERGEKEDYFDDDEIDKHIKGGKIKIEDFDLNDIEEDED